MEKRKKTKKNPRAAGRKPKFKPEYGTAKRIMVSLPSKKVIELRTEIEAIIKPYTN